MKRVVLALALTCSACSTSRLLDVAMRSADEPRAPHGLRVGDREVLAGDMHTHVMPPDAPYHVSRELPSTLELASKEGLDFVVLTPHVPARFFEDEDERGWVLETQAQLRARLAALHPAMIVVPGMEYTDYRFGHVGLAFADVREVLADVPTEAAQQRPELFFERWRAHGGLATINHPVERPIATAPFRQLRADLSWRAFTGAPVPPEIGWITHHADAVETFNLSISHLRDPYFLGDEDRSLREATHLVEAASRAQHRRIAPVGGTDSHGEWLRPTTYVLARTRTEGGIRDAIREARTCVRAPEACTLQVRAADGEWHIVGDALPATDRVEARASGGAVTFVVNGVIAAEAPSDTVVSLPIDHCALVRAVVGRSWSAPIYVGCDVAR
ncbi:MAG TPA: hypothetical protein VIF62_16695 [Labilithrix sp.]